MIDWSRSRHITVMLRFVSCSIFALACLSLGACDRTFPTLDGEPGVDPGADASLPTGRACELPGEVASCDGEAVAYCSYMDASDATEYGPCLEPEEVECEPGDWKHVPGPETGDEWEDICSGTDYSCQIAGGVPYWEEVPCETPLVLSFDASPVEMIAAESTPAASFDISMRPDSCIMTDWPSAATPWLVVDLDGNGMIDGGHELFGSGTRLADGHPARHGFAALAEFDQNGDERVDGLDARFGELMLWRDWDADRVSTPDELTPLSDSGVDGLPVDFEVAVECDERGNCGVQRASFSHAGGVGELVDLYLACH